MANHSLRVIIAAASDHSSREDILGALKCRGHVKEALISYGHTVLEEDIALSDRESGFAGAARRISDLKADCVFNLFEGFSGEPSAEASFAGALEDRRLKFTGNGSRALETCLDKARTKQILYEQGVKTPLGITVMNMSDIIGCDIGFPVFIKPRGEDASIGIDARSVALDGEMFYRNIEYKLREFPGGLIVEEFIPGRELNVGFMGDYPYDLVGVSVLDYSCKNGCPQYMGYTAKWETSTEEYLCLVPEVVDGNISDSARKAVDISRSAARALGCRGYFRVDLREKGEELYVLDVNPNPDINPDSGFMRQGYSTGASYASIVSNIVELAIRT